MKAPEQPFVQMSIDVLDVMPMLSLATRAVFWALGAFVADPVAPTFTDIVDFARLSKPSVSMALRFLCKNNLAHCFVDEEGTSRYRPDEKYFRYRSAPVSVRERAPVSDAAKVKPERKGEVKKNFTCPSDVVVPNSEKSNTADQENNNRQILPEVRSILAAQHIHEPLLSKLARSITVEKARECFEEWAPCAPATFTNPALYAAKRLEEDPHWSPPEAPRKQTWFAEFDEFVNR